jgi:biopolymer transport protein ExbB/TolQ
VTDWQLVFLGVMATALVVMAVAQFLVALAMMRTIERVSEAVVQLQRDVRPLVDKATRIAEDASRVTALAVVQAERIDELVRSTAARVDETLGLVQSAVVRPIRQGTAILAAVRAALAVMRAWQGQTSTGPVREDEDPLFVG